MSELNSIYNIVKFRKSEIYRVDSGFGVYRVIALPVTFSKSIESKSLLTSYINTYKAFCLSSWENPIPSKLAFNDRKISVDLNTDKSLSKKINDNLEQISTHEHSFDIIKKISHFLPSLYIGKSDNLRIRFTQHLNRNNDDSLLNRIKEHSVFKDCFLYFAWINLEEPELDILESILIQTSNPYFNEQRS